MENQVFHAFTVKFNGKTNVLFTDIHVSEAFDPSNTSTAQLPTFEQCRAIWDTGATNCCVTERFAKKLGLKPIGKVRVSNTSGEEIKDAYYVNVRLPNKVLITHIKATECKELVGGFDFLIGMDIIGAGDLAVTHADEKTTLSYRIPSIETIDYVVLAEAQNAQMAIRGKLKSQAESRKPKISKKLLRAKRKKERRNKKKSYKRR